MNDILVEHPNHTAETALSAARCWLVWLRAGLLTDEIHADPVSSIDFLLDVPVDHQVLGVPYGVVGAADHQCGAAVGRDQVGVAGGARDGDGAMGAVPNGHAVELAGVVAVTERLLAPASILRVSRWRCHGGQA